jgi:glycosyltransferase involved in cell wall biosynthesis
MMAAGGLRLIRWLARRWPSHIICNSRQTAADFDVDEQDISVIPCGIDSKRFSPNGRRPGNRPRVGMIARFAPLKGQHIFVEAAGRLAERYPQAEFVLAGVPLFGESSYALEVRAAASALPNGTAIRFLGFVNDVPALLHTLDIVVNPSVHPEGLGQVIIEGMMTGKPVVASALGGPIDVIEDGITGRLVPPNDASALADALDEMLRDEVKASAMGLRGRRRALERYDIQATAQAVERVYEKVLAAS